MEDFLAFIAAYNHKHSSEQKSFLYLRSCKAFMHVLDYSFNIYERAKHHIHWGPKVRDIHILDFKSSSINQD